MRKDGWLPIVGGNHNGQEYYPPNQPVAGKPVFLGQPVEGGRTTNYIFAPDCKSVIHTDRTFFGK